jgi:polyferredoxin
LASTVQLAKSRVVSKPLCCYKCPAAGCYDKANQQRLFALTQKVRDGVASRRKMCMPGEKCPVLSGIKAVANSKAVVSSLLDALPSKALLSCICNKEVKHVMRLIRKLCRSSTLGLTQPAPIHQPNVPVLHVICQYHFPQ